MLILDSLGPVAQLVARLVRNEKVTGSIPVRSTQTLRLCGYPCHADGMLAIRKVVTSLAAVALLVLSGCTPQQATDSSFEVQDSEFISEDAAEASVDDGAPLWELKPSPFAVDLCKIPDGRPSEMQTLRQGALSLGTYGMSNVGFPASPDLIPTMGESHYIAVAVSFPDLVGDPENLDEYLREQTELMSEWVDFWSQGVHRYTFDVVEGWLEVPSSAESFRVDDRSRSQRTTGVHAALAGEIAMELGSDVDWEKVDGILAVFPLAFTSFPGDWNGRGDPIVTPAGVLPMFYYGGGPFHLTASNGIPLETKRELLWSFWIHEILHSQSMNLHAPGNGWPVGLDRNQYPAGYEKFSGAANSWELFKIGWIMDDQVHCIDARETVPGSQVMLTPLEVEGGDRKIAIVRTGPHSGLLVESRRPIGYTKWDAEDSGIMVSRLDTTVMNDRSGEGGDDCGNNPDYAKWAYFLAPDGSVGLENSCFFEEFILSEGDSVSADGVTIELVHSATDLDYVSVFPAQEE